MAKPAMQAHPLPSTADRHCSFCGKDADHARFLTAGVAGGMICDMCWLKAFFIFAKAHIASAFRIAAL
jgi:ClpX C4-type zinc finger protein